MSLWNYWILLDILAKDTLCHILHLRCHVTCVRRLYLNDAAGEARLRDILSRVFARRRIMTKLNEPLDADWIFIPIKVAGSQYLKLACVAGSEWTMHLYTMERFSPSRLSVGSDDVFLAVRDRRSNHWQYKLIQSLNLKVTTIYINSNTEFGKEWKTLPPKCNSSSSSSSRSSSSSTTTTSSHHTVTIMPLWHLIVTRVKTNVEQESALGQRKTPPTYVTSRLVSNTTGKYRSMHVNIPPFYHSISEWPSLRPFKVTQGQMWCYR